MLRPARDRRLISLNVIRKAVMEQEVRGYFGVQWNDGFDDDSRIHAIRVTFENGTTLVITGQTDGCLDVSLRA